MCRLASIYDSSLHFNKANFVTDDVTTSPGKSYQVNKERKQRSKQVLLYVSVYVYVVGTAENQYFIQMQPKNNKMVRSRSRNQYTGSNYVIIRRGHQTK